jgi:hypothetical protein
LYQFTLNTRCMVKAEAWVSIVERRRLSDRAKSYIN